MPTSCDVQDPTKNQPALLRVFPLVRDKGLSLANGCLSDGVGMVARILLGALFLFTANGCLATRSWVEGQLNPITGRLNDTDAKLQNLHLERQLVLDSRSGPTFAIGSAALTEHAKSEIDGFLQDLAGSTNPGSASGRLFVVAGYTDSVGGEDY
ncbi:MAG: hypothetical protein ACREQC_11205, partial [Candidatus Binataceae bacterium]